MRCGSLSPDRPCLFVTNEQYRVFFGSLLLAGGEKGKRVALPNARSMVHQPSGGFQGQASDIARHAEEIAQLKHRLHNIYVKHTGQNLDVVENALDRDNFLNAEAAKDFGIIDEVIESRSLTEGEKENGAESTEF